jgi:hypothetical protein
LGFAFLPSQPSFSVFSHLEAAFVCLFELLECLLSTRQDHYLYLVALSILGLGATMASAVGFDHKLSHKVLVGDDVALDGMKGAGSPSMGGKMLKRARKAVSRRIRGTVVSYRRGGVQAALVGVIRRAMKRIDR